MKFLVFFALIGYAVGTQYVWDILKPALNAAEVQAILSSRSDDYPKYNSIPDSDFDCSSKKNPGFYADVSTKCQVFHRCDINGNQTSYLCVNTTVFNQITLVCDYFYNVDCDKFAQYDSFANSRLYSDKPLFDSPPASYVAPEGRSMEGSDSSSNQVQPGVKPAKPVKGGKGKATTKATTTVAPSTEETSSAAPEESTSAASASSSEAPAEGSSAAPSGASSEAPAESSSAAPAEASSEASAESSSAAPAEASSEASAEGSSAAPADAASEASAESSSAAPAEASSEASAEGSSAAPAEASSEASDEETTAAPSKPQTMAAKAKPKAAPKKATK